MKYENAYNIAYLINKKNNAYFINFHMYITHIYISFMKLSIDLIPKLKRNYLW